ncbi:hypothetical protein CEXT_90081 [Caerostris extrusa]|uniref:Uncharacterized protein n=1 Tax=Caerostris extrusa TaxID=172846 RepID=A0AAV4WRA2_CAEEX|nr:hypothetical protein CEXT_90081 [Caerostris extrusa]
MVYVHIDGNPCSHPWLSRLPMKCEKALDNLEASLDSSFSPVCHRTRQQVKDRLCANLNAQADVDVVETLCELINDVS